MKHIISTANAPAAIGPYSQAVIANGMIYTSGQLPIKPATGEMPDTIEEQTRASLENIRAILEHKQIPMESIVKTTVFLKDMNDFAAMNKVYQTYFKDSYPARSAVAVAALPKDAKVEIEAVALLD